MFHLVLGWLTEHREGDPEVIFCGADGDAAMDAGVNADPKFLRVEKAFVLESFKLRSGLVEVPKSARKAKRAKADQGPSLEEAMQMLEEIDRLTTTLADERAKRAEEIVGIQEEFKRQIQVSTDLITNLQAELATRNSPPIEKSEGGSQETPAVPESPEAAQSPVPVAEASGTAADGPKLEAPVVDEAPKSKNRR